MGKDIREPAGAHELEPVSLSELIHQHVRAAIETAVHEELQAALATAPYEPSEARQGYRSGTKKRSLTGPTGPVALILPRASLFSGAGAKEWTSAIVRRYQRRMPDVNEAVVATYLAGGALQPLLKAAPLSKSAVSRVVATLKGGLEAWRTRSLAAVDVIYLYLDGFALRVRSAGKVVSVPVLGVVGLCGQWRDRPPALAAFERTWAKRCPGVVTSLREGGDELLTFFRFPKTQWKTLRTTNVIERLHEDFRRRVKTQGSRPTDDAALLLLFSLVASGQITLRRIDAWRKIAAVLSQHTSVAPAAEFAGRRGLTEALSQGEERQ